MMISEGSTVLILLPNKVVLAEMPGAELYQPSGEVDLATDRTLSRFEVLQRNEALKHGGSVVINPGTCLSEDARRINSALTRDDGLSPEQKHGRYIVAVVAHRPPEQAS